MALDTHPYLAKRLKKELSYKSTPFWAFMAFSRAKFDSCVYVVYSALLLLLAVNSIYVTILSANMVHIQTLTTWNCYQCR